MYPSFWHLSVLRTTAPGFTEDWPTSRPPVTPHLHQRQAAPVLKYIDAQIVPFLLRYISSGTDEFFEGLCILATQVTSPEIDTVLAGLLYRWTQRFDMKSRFAARPNHALWRGFKRLTEHPRFDMVDGWQSRLASDLQCHSLGTAREYVRVLERDPRSYTLIDSRLFRATNWQHFHHDEIDRLDVAAERLFLSCSKIDYDFDCASKRDQDGREFGPRRSSRAVVVALPPCCLSSRS